MTRKEAQDMVDDTAAKMVKARNLSLELAVDWFERAKAETSQEGRIAYSDAGCRLIETAQKIQAKL